MNIENHSLEGPTVIYLHGFASSPTSTKATYFAEHLRALGLEVHVPDLNHPSFNFMTLSSQLKVIEDLINSLPLNAQKKQRNLLMIGSSMGGLLCTLAAQRLCRPDALILMAPGFSLPERWNSMVGHEGMIGWKTNGKIPVFHHGENKELDLDYRFITDASQYTTSGIKLDIPTLVFHGRRDDTVPFGESVSFREINDKMVELHLLDDNHDLIDSLPTMWQVSEDFLSRLGACKKRIPG